LESAPAQHDPASQPPEPAAAAVTINVTSADQQVVTVERGRLRSADITSEVVLRQGEEVADRKDVLLRSSKENCSHRDCLYKARECFRNRGDTNEGARQSDVISSPEEPAAVMRSNSKYMKDKRRIFRSWSFFGAKSSPDDFTKSLCASPTSSSTNSSTSSMSSPLCSTDTFTTFSTPRRWSRLVEEKRRSLQSSIFPEAFSFLSVSGKLSSRVNSEPNVTPKKCNRSHEQVTASPQKLSKNFEKRKSVASCIFSETVNEDFTPYVLADTRPTYNTASRFKAGNPEPPKRRPDLKLRKFSLNGNIQERRESAVRDSCLARLESASSESKITNLAAQLTKCNFQPAGLEPRVRKHLPRRVRPKSLIIIPELQVEKSKRNVKSDGKVTRPEAAMLRKSESLSLSKGVRISTRDQKVTPHQTSQISSESRSQSHDNLTMRDPVDGPDYMRCHRDTWDEPDSMHRQKDPVDWRNYLRLQSESSLFESHNSAFRTPGLALRERRKSSRSWSYCTRMVTGPTGKGREACLTEGSPRKSEKKALRTFRARTLFPRETTPYTIDALRPCKLFSRDGTPGIIDTSTCVIFPWRRGEQRNSGRRSPSPYNSQSPASTLSDSQSQTCPLPEESTNGCCEVASDPKRKDGVWWRGRASIPKTTRTEKASSSPVFRRASLSHSEWDIRRPWSHVYSEREAAKLSHSVCRLSVTSGEDGGVTTVEVVEEGVEGGPRSLPHMPSTVTTSSEGMFQKFKKSLSLRLAKRGSRSESLGSCGSQSAPVGHTSVQPSLQEAYTSAHPSLLEAYSPAHPSLLETQTLPRRRSSVGRDDDTRNTGFLLGHPLFRSSKERRKARLKDARSSKCNSGDSGDSGIELVGGCGQVTLDMSAHTFNLDVNNYVDPAFVASLADDGGSSLCEGNPRAVRRTHSDVGGVGGRTCLHYSRQLSTPQPIKIRPAHRLPQHTASLHRSKSLKRSKGSSHLRRSVSQPLDLDKAYDTPTSTLRKCRSPTNAQNTRQRRPSAGNILNDDNTTSEDEIGISDSEDFKTDLKRSLEEDDDMIVYAEALWDHVTLDSEELVFKAGDLITVIDSSDKDWWWGRISHRAGWFPAAFVRILVNQEDHQESRIHDARILGPARKLSVSGLSHDQIRTNVINEIISTERDFVKHLRDVVKGYLRQVRKRPDMFSDDRISTIFGNMEALYQFQSNFLRELELCIDWQEPHKSCIGATFIRNREKFEIYSEYCNNHPAAMSSLQELYQDQKYIHFFEACRLLQEMIDISLDGFLLTPVQKICKYPLQLQELLKYTKPDHPDYTSVQGALEAMRDVALLVNERKRRMECLEKIASWQITVEGWEGPELLEDSSQLIYQGEVTKGAGGSWPKEVTLFLFDHQLVYCKRDLLKRNTFVYRGRLNLDMCEVVDLPDGKDSSLNISVHNGWKIRSLEKNKWYVFSCKSAAEKQKWMEAFRRERELVAADEYAGFVVAEKAKHLAKVAARNQRNRPKRPRTTKSHKRVQAMTYAQAELLVNVDPEIRSNSLPSGVQPPEGKKKGLWFSFGGHKKGRGSGRNATQIQHHPV
ncbi:hypothetical protein OTU49_002558, partial [Cherax quadricarinatus]